MIDPIQNNVRSERNKTKVIRAALNILSIFINNNELEAAMNLIVYLEKCEIHEYDMYERMTFIYQKAIYSFKMGEQSSLELIENCKKIFEFTESYNTLQMIESEITELIDNGN